MRRRFGSILVGAVVCLAATVSWAQLTPYSQNFEGLNQMDPGALAADGWQVFGNVFDPGGGFLYPYGPFPAPNGGPGFCGIDVGQGGPDQGAQQLVVYNDYNNGDHANGFLIEANVFQQWTVGADDVGEYWRFAFDHKRGNIEGNSTALAFIKTLDPNNGFALTNFITADMTNISDQWGRSALAITIEPALEGQILQIGFLSVATLFQGSGIFYDNITFREEDPLLVVLSSFEAEMTRNGVRITWETALEIDTVSFRLLRETGGREKRFDVIATVPAAGTEFNGARYEAYDLERIGGTVRYILEEVDRFGKVTRHGPAELIRPNGRRSR